MNGEQPNAGPRSIEEITGAELFTVAFVLDYIQFHFQSDAIHGIVTAYTNPVVLVDGREHSNLCGAWRDAMCSLMPRHVVRVSVDEGVAITIDLEGSSKIIIPILEREFVESATYHPVHPPLGGMSVY
jgi:hypothetical protein